MLSYHYLGQLLILGVPVFLQVYLVRTIGLENLADVSSHLALFSIVQAVGASFSFYYVSVLSKADSEDEVRQRASLFVGVDIVIRLFCLVIYVGLGFFFLSSNLWMVLVFLFPLFTGAFSADYYYQATLKSKFVFYRRLTTRIILVVFVFVFVHDENSIEEYVLIYSVILVLEHAINFFSAGLSVSIERKTFTPLIRSVFGAMSLQFVYNQLPNIAIIRISQEGFASDALIVLIRFVNTLLTFITSASVYGVVSVSRNKINDGCIYYFLLIIGFATYVSAIVAKPIFEYLFTPGVTVDYFDFVSISVILFTHPFVNQYFLNFYVSKRRYCSVVSLYLCQLVLFLAFCMVFGVSVSFALANVFLFLLVVSKFDWSSMK